MRQLDPAQMEQLKQIGEYLAQVREEQNIPLQEIALKTYIPLRLLQALETVQVEQLPEPVFVQGFIRRYAENLGLDGVEIAQSFEYGAISSQTPPSSEAGTDRAIEPAIKVVQTAPQRLPARTQPRRSRDRRYGRRSSSRSYVPFAIAGGLILFVGLGLTVASMWGKLKLGSVFQVGVFSSSKSTANPASSKASSSKTSQKTGLSDGSPIQVTVDLQEDSWLEVIIDGKQEFADTLKKGEKKTWTAQKILTINSGNAGGVMISYNQGEPKLLGSRGQVKEITFPPKQKESSSQPN
jgi:cytoskeleton protein RodZ